MAHGGKRPGAGRPKGAVTVRTQKIIERALAEGKAPLEVMLDNMRHFQQLALDAEAVLASMKSDDLTGGSPEEQFKALLAEVKKAAGLRQMAHDCASDAAPYMHPRLAAVEHSGELNIKRSAEMTDDELANIAARGGKGTSAPKVDPSQLN